MAIRSASIFSNQVKRRSNPESGKCEFCRLVEPAGLRPAHFGCEAARRDLATVSFQNEALDHFRAATPKNAGRLLRDAKLHEIGAGTNEIRRMLIGRDLFDKSPYKLFPFAWLMA